MAQSTWLQRQLVNRPWLNLVLVVCFLIISIGITITGGHSRGGMPMRPVGVVGVAAFSYAAVQVLKKIRGRSS
jgi:hypothetical protein